ncbi:MAG: HlyD family efflux transporter periplasmic adaptor subunit [Verrucomicrobia bacterium]|nr:MAG: HlyD family efflux transporter periplasmic adaptor subunit [Verrucomicrobiota bacterium]
MNAEPALSVPDRAGRIVSRILVFGVAASALFAAGCGRGGAATDETIRISGNIEAVDVRLAFKQPGHLLERLVDEGQSVSAGAVVARLDAAEWRHEVALRRAELSAAEARLAELEAGARPQEIAAAAAAVASAEAELERARLEYRRQEELHASEAAAVRDLERARAQLRVAEARVAEARERLALVREGPRVETIEQARAQVERARAALELARTHLSDTELASPIDGVVLAKHAEPGEVLMAGAPVITVADLRHVWLRAYVNETDLGRIRLGQPVAVYTDSYPGKRYEGRLSFIADEAEFTPKTVQTEKERVTLVYRVKIDLDNASGELKPGMVADAELMPIKS